ncbi:MAG: D-glycero-beta-D-manno-heptose-7-phosphate kinase [Thermodesulfovibrionales bacterium]
MDLLSALKAFRGKKILVIGDLILDRYIWGKVSRISPEAPVPVVEVSEDSFVLGGAANVGNNIVALGGHATVAGAVGSDMGGEMLRELLNQRGVEFYAALDRRPTTVKTRVIAHSQQVVRFDQENRDGLSGKALRELVAFIEEAAPGHDAVVISDYRKGVISADVIRAVMRAAGKKKFVAVDPKIGHFHLYKGVSLITPNLMEAAHGASVEITDLKSMVRAGRALLRKLGCGAVLITRGEGGMSLFQNGGVSHIPALARKVYDVTGAGDTVVAAIALARAAGCSLEDAAVLANHAAGIVVGEVGTAVATPARIRQSIRGARLDIERERF